MDRAMVYHVGTAGSEDGWINSTTMCSRRAFSATVSIDNKRTEVFCLDC